MNPHDRATILERARAHARAGRDDDAKQAYVERLRTDPADRDALVELGALALSSHHLAAARTAFQQAVRCRPADPLANAGLATILLDAGDLDAAVAYFRAALAADPGHAEAHQGLARALAERGEHAAAEPHWRQGFTGRAIVRRRFRGTGAGIPLLLLASARGGNIPTRHLIDETCFAVTAIHADFHDPATSLPRHDLLFNAIGDADFCPAALDAAAAIAARSHAPIINPPARVRATGRAAIARRLAGIDGLVVPSIETVSRADLTTRADLALPLLIRAPGFHTGRHFARVDTRASLDAALSDLPGDPLLAIQVLDARGPDGLARKYRVMAVGGALYPLHLAISPGWKVHYVTSAMASVPSHRAEEARFLADMPATLGPRAMTALQQIAGTLGLDYAGIDFGLARDGILLFEANATMVVNPPEPDPIWDYRRPAAAAILRAVDGMLRARARRSI